MISDDDLSLQERQNNEFEMLQVMYNADITDLCKEGLQMASYKIPTIGDQ